MVIVWWAYIIMYSRDICHIYKEMATLRPYICTEQVTLLSTTMIVGGIEQDYKRRKVSIHVQWHRPQLFGNSFRDHIYMPRHNCMSTFEIL